MHDGQHDMDRVKNAMHIRRSMFAGECLPRTV